MSGIWMMVSKGGPNPEDVVITTHVEGLDQMRRQAGRYLVASVSLIILNASLIVSALWGKAHWFFILANTFMMALVTVSAIISGMFVGRYLAFRDLLKADAKVTKITIDKESDGE